MGRPCLASRRGGGVYTADRALGHVALRRRGAVQAPCAQPVDEGVHEVGDIGGRRLGEVGGDRLPGQWLGNWRRQHHGFDAKARVDRLQLVAQQAGQPLDIADRLGHADADHLDPVVDAVEPHIERASAQALGFKGFAERLHQLQSIPSQGLRRADRLGEHPADLDEFGSLDRLDGLARPAIGLVKAAGQFWPEPQRQGRARLSFDLAHSIDTHLAQGVGHAVGQGSAQVGRWAMARPL